MSIRYSVMNELAVEEDITIYNPLSIDWSSFEWLNGYIPHKLTRSERLKPYLISYKYYSSVLYENIILLLNNIEDITNLPIGTEIMVPIYEDVVNFLKENRK